MFAKDLSNKIFSVYPGSEETKGPHLNYLLFYPMWACGRTKVGHRQLFHKLKTKADFRP